ncbi:hypothetical protein AKJ09_00215 [Labilithrix luteola]|uniref:Uncharacterized protein n=1 Tax=Labilithrix luteola TaxID=1391654 RepID=A0A0K1PJG6_9BACT|nr:hypothetical protein AKJ09_00215 [Labilithrix luteola]
MARLAASAAWLTTCVRESRIVLRDEGHGLSGKGTRGNLFATALWKSLSLRARDWGFRRRM